jgi:catechol 2,3-dioxygenase-like lactoylglutathione lyase family enzyme
MCDHDKTAAFIRRIYETHLNVRSLDRSLHFYRQVLGLNLALRDDARGLGFCWIGEPGQAFLGLWEKPAGQVVRQHVAFEIDLATLEDAVKSLTCEGLDIRNFFDERTTVPTVFGWMPAASVYFDDPDGHLLELLARLPGPPRPELGIVSLPEWSRLTGT